MQADFEGMFMVSLLQILSRTAQIPENSHQKMCWHCIYLTLCPKYLLQTVLGIRFH